MELDDLIRLLNRPFDKRFPNAFIQLIAMGEVAVPRLLAEVKRWKYFDSLPEDNFDNELFFRLSESAVALGLIMKVHPDSGYWNEAVTTLVDCLEMARQYHHRDAATVALDHMNYEHQAVLDLRHDRTLSRAERVRARLPDLPLKPVKTKKAKIPPVKVSRIPEGQGLLF